MAPIEKDAEREERIHDEIIVDAHGGEEQALSWFYYLRDHLQFPFTAACDVRRPTSPLKVNDKVEVLSMTGEGDWGQEMHVTIGWKDDELAVPLAQLRPVGADEETQQAVEDWHYWVARGYRF
jgi:hypothetical protein